MQFERNRMYRVKAVADALDVSVNTIYRAIESGRLDAFNLGNGRGTLRVPGYAVSAYLEQCGQAAYDALVVDGHSAAAADNNEQSGEVA